jgi:hypothetical protein
MIEEPDRTTKGIRFGCGALLGSICGLSFALYSLEPTTRNIIAACLAFIGLFGTLAVKFGDRFWEQISRVLWWW